MLALDRGRAQLGGFVSGEEDRPSCSFCVALKHDITLRFAACGEAGSIFRSAREIECVPVSVVSKFRKRILQWNRASKRESLLKAFYDDSFERPSN